MTKTVHAMAQALVIAHLLGEVQALPAYTTLVDYGIHADVKEAGAGTASIPCGTYMRAVKGLANLSNYYTKDFFSGWTTAAEMATSATASNICAKTAWETGWCTGIKNAGNTAWLSGYTYIAGVAVANTVVAGLSINGVAACP